MDGAIQRLNNRGLELKGPKTIDGSTSDWLSLISRPRSLVKYWFSVHMHELLFSFVYAITSARSSGFDEWLSSCSFMHRIVLKVPASRKNAIKGLQHQNEKLIEGWSNSKNVPYPVAPAWDYRTGVNVACVQTPHSLRKNKIFPEGMGEGGSVHRLG